jgi:hypothetical protein
MILKERFDVFLMHALMNLRNFTQSIVSMGIWIVNQIEMIVYTFGIID